MSPDLFIASARNAKFFCPIGGSSMPNMNIFKSLAGIFTPRADTVNEAGGLAYKMSPEQALAQYAATGCFNNTFYADGAEQLDKVLALTAGIEPAFIAKTAVYARETGLMKDMPAFLLAVLSIRDKQLFETVFPRIVDNGKMLRNFVQIMRSGVVGRKSLGSLPNVWSANGSINANLSRSFASQWGSRRRSPTF